MKYTQFLVMYSVGGLTQDRYFQCCLCILSRCHMDCISFEFLTNNIRLWLFYAKRFRELHSYLHFFCVVLFKKIFFAHGPIEYDSFILTACQPARANLWLEFRELHSYLYFFAVVYNIYQPLRSGRIWHKVNFLSGVYMFECRVFLLLD